MVYFQLQDRDKSNSQAVETKSVFSSQLVAATNFPLYQPSWLPEGYNIDANSVAQPQEGVVVFSLVGGASGVGTGGDSSGLKDSKDKIHISEVARSETYDYGGFFSRIEKNAQFQTKLGQAVVGYVDNEKTVIGSLVSEKTWIIVNGKADSLTTDDIKKILHSFAK